MSHGSKSGKKLLRACCPLHSEDDGGADFRLLLHQRTRQLKAAMETIPLNHGYYLPNFADKCFACGKCEKACRAGALKQEDLPDGQTRMVVTPWKCSECGVCVAACSNKGLDGMKLRQLTTLGPVSVHRCTKTLCKKCGKPLRRAVWMVYARCATSGPHQTAAGEAAARSDRSCVKSGRPKRPPRKPPRRQPKPAADAAEPAVQMAAAPQKPLRPVP